MHYLEVHDCLHQLGNPMGWMDETIQMNFLTVLGTGSPQSIRVLASLSGLLVHSMTISSFIHVAADDIILVFLWLSRIPLCIYTTSSLSLSLSMCI